MSREVMQVWMRHFRGHLLACLTARGVDVATGLAIVPGVQRPSPR